MSFSEKSDICLHAKYLHCSWIGPGALQNQPAVQVLGSPILGSLASKRPWAFCLPSDHDQAG